MSILLAYSLLMLAIHIIDQISTAHINTIAWNLYNKLPTLTHRRYSEQILLRTEVLRLKKELGSVSAQDQFSKWAKLRRQHDRAVANLDKCSSALELSRSKLERNVNTIRLIFTTGLRFLLQLWFSNRPLFWLPTGLFPGWLEWCLALPRAPKGSISLYIWGLSCSFLILYVQGSINATYSTYLTTRNEGANSGRYTNNPYFTYPTKTLDEQRGRGDEQKNAASTLKFLS